MEKYFKSLITNEEEKKKMIMESNEKHEEEEERKSAGRVSNLAMGENQGRCCGRSSGGDKHCQAKTIFPVEGRQKIREKKARTRLE